MSQGPHNIRIIECKSSLYELSYEIEEAAGLRYPVYELLNIESLKEIAIKEKGHPREVIEYVRQWFRLDRTPGEWIISELPKTKLLMISNAGYHTAPADCKEYKENAGFVASAPAIAKAKAFIDLAKRCEQLELQNERLKESVQNYKELTKDLTLIWRQIK